ncbi:MAG: XdhC family protein [Methylococcaceae bacterium]|nr:XdhC family protein [Methylococcaceae bacterium]
MTQQSVWQWLIDALRQNQPVTLLLVVASKGSSPGKIGAKMAVSATGVIGTIGGGGLEIGLIEAVRASMVKGLTEPKIHSRMHHASETGTDSGMICGGEQTILAYPCRIQDIPLFEKLAECCRLRTPKRLVISRRGLQLIDAGAARLPAHFDPGEDWLYQEVIGRHKCAYIIGGGHVSLMLSKVLDLLNFDSVVIDEREGLETMQSNGVAWKKIIILYAEIDKVIPEGPEVFVIIMTHNHRTDAQVLAKLAAKNVPYLGLLGSRKKIASIKEALSRQLPEQTLQRLHAPIGLPIKSHTPAEIAISIAAELIQWVNSDDYPIL